jgi:hypothetical protein
MEMEETERRKQKERFFNPDFFKAAKEFFKSKDLEVVAKAKSKLEEVAGIINNPEKRGKTVGWSKIESEIHGIFATEGENAELLSLFLSNFPIDSLPLEKESLDNLTKMFEEKRKEGKGVSPGQL